jgi:undecaprenyl-diphosphatase
MLLAVGLVQGPIKGTLRRQRPFVREVARVVGRRPVDTSFPSGHTAGSFAAAVALSCFYPRDAPMLLGTATAVGLSRVYLGLHFPSDVLVGAGLGSAVGLIARRLVQG